MDVYFQGKWLNEREQKRLFRILEEKAATAPPDIRDWIQKQMVELDKAGSFTCPDCKLTSYNENDVKNRYCGNCHKFFKDPV